MRDAMCVGAVEMTRVEGGAYEMGADGRRCHASGRKW